jgi:hypothetical protein
VTFHVRIWFGCGAVHLQTPGGSNAGNPGLHLEEVRVLRLQPVATPASCTCPLSTFHVPTCVPGWALRRGGSTEICREAWLCPSSSATSNFRHLVLLDITLCLSHCVVGRIGRHGRKLKLKETEPENSHIALRMK